MQSTEDEHDTWAIVHQKFRLGTNNEVPHGAITAIS